MSAAYVRNAYGVDFKRGERVAVDGKPGTIVSFPDQYLGVRFDGEKHTERCHPKWRVERLARPGKLSRGESPCCPGVGSMAHVRGCRNHPEAAA